MTDHGDVFECILYLKIASYLSSPILYSSILNHNLKLHFYGTIYIPQNYVDINLVISLLFEDHGLVSLSLSMSFEMH